MLEMLMQWYRRRFSDPEAIALLVILVAGFGILFFFSGLLAPLLVAIVLAYLLEWPTARLEHIGCSRRWATSIVLVLFVGILLLKQGVAGFSELAATVRWWTLIPGLLGSFFVFASISGYQNVGAATTIAVLVASQLIGGLVLDVLRSQGIPLRALIGPVCGAVMLVVGAWLVARRQF